MRPVRRSAPVFRVLSFSCRKREDVPVSVWYNGTEWLPTSGFEFAEGPDVEVYFRPDPRQTAYEVWILVKKR